MRKRNNQGETKTMLCRHYSTTNRKQTSALVPLHQAAASSPNKDHHHHHHQHQHQHHDHHQHHEQWTFPVSGNVHDRSWGKRKPKPITMTRMMAMRNACSFRQSDPWTSADFSISKKLGEGYFGSVVRANYTDHASNSVEHRQHNEQDARDDADHDGNGSGNTRVDNGHGDDARDSNQYPYEYVALKRFCKSRIRQSQKRGDRALELLQREINIHSHLQHEYIVKFAGYYQDPTHISLVLEYCAMGDLVTHMAHWRGRQQRLERCRLYLRQVTEALAYLDQLQVAHRDIKPENMVLTDRDTVKLCDFGWAVWWQPGHFQRTLCGTAEYVVPEMLQIRQGQTQRMYHAKFVDPWALGILAIELFQGASPFCPTEMDLEVPEVSKKNDQEVIFEKIRRFTGIDKTVAANKSADKDMSNFWDLVSRLVQIEPESRISASEALDHAFFLGPHDDTRMRMEPRSSALTNFQPTVAQRCQIFQQPTSSSSSSSRA